MVKVVTTPPYYPAWEVQGRYAPWRYQQEHVAGIQVQRCPLWVPRAPTTIKRMLHLASFALSSALPCLWQALRWRPDLVWTVEPTVLAAPVALLAARLGGAQACLHVQDLEIDAACDLQLVAGSWLRRTMCAGYRWIIRRFDLVSTISERMRRRLRRLGVARERLLLFPNWVDTRAIRPLEQPARIRRQFGFGDAEVIALYAGSMGEKQGLDLLIDVAERLRARPQVRLVLCGAGAARGRLEQALAGQTNVTLLPLQPEARLNELLNAADIHVLPQRPEAGAFALPSKLGGILASGRPVIAHAAGGELAIAARHGGLVVAPGDAVRMADAIVQLADDPERRRQLGQAARRFAKACLERDPIIARYESRLVELCARRRATPTLRERLRPATTRSALWAARRQV